MHEKLKHQIEHYLGHAFSPPETWNDFLTAVDETYRRADHHNLIQEQAQNSISSELEENYRNMKDFVSIVSHDLKEPLRKVMVFGSFLLENHSDQLDVKGKDYLDRMIKSTDRMNLFIDDLLLYSEVGIQELNFQSVDLQTLIRRTISDLAHPEPGRHFNHHIEVVNFTAEPLVEADPSQMKLLFRNLLLNATKFLKRDIPPVIRIEIKDSNIHFISVQVQDNGIGFRQDYAWRVFKPFERLHGKSEYPGTGMGLPICLRMVTRHGGKITALGAPQQGATFTVTLPKKQVRKKYLY